MDQPNALLSRRQFGRRDTDRSANAIVSGRSAIKCAVRNLSEGRALIQFPDLFVPNRPFRLDIEGAPISLLCEVRHSGKYGVGVKFLNPADGPALIRHLYPSASQINDEGAIDPTSLRAASPPLPVISHKALRMRVLAELARRMRELAELEAHAEREKPIAKQIEERVLHSLHTMLRGRLTAAQPQAPITDAHSDGALSQPRRSRRNGIKGRSAGGIG